MFLSTMHTLIVADATQLDAQTNDTSWNLSRIFLEQTNNLPRPRLRSPGMKEVVRHGSNMDPDTTFYWLITAAIFSSYGL